MKKTTKKIVGITLVLMFVAVLFVGAGAATGGNESKIGDTEYATLADALNNVKDGETIEILVDRIAIPKITVANITIKGNGSIYDGTATNCTSIVVGVDENYPEKTIISKEGVTISNFTNLSLTGTLINLTIDSCKLNGEYSMKWCYVDAGKFVTIKNSIFEPTGQYGIHFDNKVKGAVGTLGTIFVENSSIKGTVAIDSSYKLIKFTDCTFAGRSDSGYCNINIYNKAEFIDCDFSSVYTTGTSRGILMLGTDDSAIVTMNGCTVDGVSDVTSLALIYRPDNIQGVGSIDAVYTSTGEEIIGGTFVGNKAETFLKGKIAGGLNISNTTMIAMASKQQDLYVYGIDLCTAQVSSYVYGADSVPSPTLVNSVNDPKGGVTFYYSSSAVGSGNPWSGLTGTTLGAGTYYVYGNFTLDGKEVSSKRTTFKVTQASQNAPGVSAEAGNGYINVTVGSASIVKNYEYTITEGSGASDENWIPADDQNGKFTIGGLKASTQYSINVRATESRNYTASPVSTASNVTLGYFTVTYNANGGVGEIEPQINVSQGSSVVAKSGNGFSRAGYTFAGWENATGDAVAVGSSITDGTTLYAQWTPNQYTVEFYGESATSITANYGETITLPTAAGGSGTFAGWAVENGGSAVYTANQHVQNLAESGTVTLYPVWKQDTFTVSGTITGAEGTVSVNLTRGNAVLQTESPGMGTSYSFAAVPAGTYNIVATDVRSGKAVTVTYVATVTTGSETVDITFPSNPVSSVLNVSDKQNTPAVVVGGLDQEAVNKAETGKNVTVGMDIEAKVEAELSPTASEDEKDTQSGIAAIKVVAGDKTLQYLGVVVTKTVEAEVEVLHETSTLIEIMIPFDANNKENIGVYRYHNGQAETLTRIYAESAKADGTFLVDETAKLIHVYSQKFSEYAIGYTVPSPTPTPTYIPSSSKQTGSTVILSEGQVAPTAYATVTPTVTPTVKPTEQPATPTVIATEKPTTQATQQSPAPFVGLLAGLGAAAVLLRLRK